MDAHIIIMIVLLFCTDAASKQVTRAAKNLSGVYKTSGGIAKEVVGEAGTIVKGVQSHGLIRGLNKYIRGGNQDNTNR
jgi:hypothetical protein